MLSRFSYFNVQMIPNKVFKLSLVLMVLHGLSSISRAATSENVPFDVCPTKTQISLRIRMKINYILAIHNASSEDSDQTARMRRLIWIFAGAHTWRYFYTLRINSLPVGEFHESVRTGCRNISTFTYKEINIWSQNNGQLWENTTECVYIRG